MLWHERKIIMNILLINCSPVQNGATAEIIKIVNSFLEKGHNTKSICIDDYDIKFCKGCRSCHKTAKCVQDDDVIKVIGEYEWADIIISVSPSYWADIPGQFKAFIDRCTPWCNTHEPHATLSLGKKGYSIALRTGPGMKECNRIIESIEHFYGHLEIEPSGSLGLCSIEYKEDLENRKSEIKDFCSRILDCYLHKPLS
jgi:Multimeric flavodoxin WrbA